MNTKKLLTQVKRELWENKIRFVYAPLVVTGLLLVLIISGVIKFQMSIGDDGIHFRSNGLTNDLHAKNVTMESMMHSLKTDGSNAYEMVIAGTTFANTSILVLVFLFVLLAYAHSCLFDDRKQKDILFWRSLPVSETTNVLVKLGFVLLYVPLMIFVLNLVVGIFVLICATVFFSYHGAALSDLFVAIVHSDIALIAPCILMSCFLSLLLLLPVIGFMFLSSAWAKKSPFLFSSVLPVGLIILDKISQEWFSINLHVIDTLRSYWVMFFNSSSRVAKYYMSDSNQLSIFDANLATGLLISVAIGAAFVVGAIWLRNNRYEI